MQNAFEFADVVNKTNYSEMSYNELVTLNFAFLLAEGEIKPLIDKKRAEEMERHTDEFVAKMNNYGASKAEILALIEKKAMREKPYGPIPSQDVDDQTPTIDVDDNQDKGESVLALPEHCPSTMDDLKEEDTDAVEAPATDGAEAEKTVSLETMGKSFVEEAVEIMKTISLPEDVKSQEPYIITCHFSYGNNGKLGHSDPFGRNMSWKDLEDFRAAREKFIRLFEKKTVLESTDDYLAYIDGAETYMVHLYHFPEVKGDGKVQSGDPGSYAYTAKDKVRGMQKKISLLKKAMKKAKELSFSDGTDVSTPFYDKYKFRHCGSNIIEPYGDKCRCYEDVDALSELKPAYETYSRLFSKNYVTLSDANCVATIGESIIYLVLFNIPKQKKSGVPAKEKKGKAAKKTAKVNNVNPIPAVNPLILKAVEMTKILPAVSGRDVNAPYFVQCDLSVIEDGQLLQKGKPFIKKVSGEEELAKFKKNHLRLAKTMKANDPVSTDDYTAYFWNEGKNLSVFYYNTKGLAATAA